MIHLHMKLMLNHPLAKPLCQRLAYITRAAELFDRWLQQFAKVNAQLGKPLLPARLPRPRQTVCIAQMTGDHLGPGFVQQETGPLKELHQAAGLRDTPLGKQNQPAAALQEGGHLLHGKRRGMIHRKGVAVGHHESKHPVAIGPGRGGNKPPVLTHA